MRLSDNGREYKEMVNGLGRVATYVQDCVYCENFFFFLFFFFFFFFFFFV